MKFSERVSRCLRINLLHFDGDRELMSVSHAGGPCSRSDYIYLNHYCAIILLFRSVDELTTLLDRLWGRL